MVCKRSHSLMDRMQACGVCDPGSIPGEGTIIKNSLNGDFLTFYTLNVNKDLIIDI